MLNDVVVVLDQHEGCVADETQENGQRQAVDLALDVEQGSNDGITSV